MTSSISSPELSGSSPPALLDSLSLYGHLLTEGFRYVPVRRNSVENDPVGWSRPSGEWSPGPTNFVAKIQRFQSGGYEVFVHAVDLSSLASLIDAPRRCGPRGASVLELDESISDEDRAVLVAAEDRRLSESRARSIRRARTKSRHLIKSMGCDRLFTLTRRESDPSSFWTRDEWAAAWARFCRVMKDHNIVVSYVAVLELHKKGNFHLHAAIDRFIPINLARGVWYTICGGRGMGNVDVRFRQDQSRYQRLSGIAKYCSKYISKQFDEVSDFNRKRYWSTRHALIAPERIILRARPGVEDAALQVLLELAEYLGLDFSKLRRGPHSAFIVKDTGSIWFDFKPDLLAPCPF